jgi:divalent metal cation (Fe/Co/Zn/Cd) transporter
MNPTAVVFSLPLVLVLALSIAVKLWMSRFNRFLGRHIQSSALLATASDSRNDAISTSAVLLAAVIEAVTGWKVDGFIGLGIALFILYSGANLAKEIISPLLGEAASPELQQKIVKTVSNNPLVLGYHDLMVHDYGPGQRFASLHVEMDRGEDPMLCHDVIDELERICLREHNVHLVIHYDPVVTDDAALEQMRTTVHGMLKAYDRRLELHDFRMVKGNHHTNLIFDIVLPYALLEHKKAIKTHLDASLYDTDGGPYYTVITFDYESIHQDI